MPFAQDSVMDVRSAARTPSGPPICVPHMHMSDTGSASEPAYLAVGRLASAIAAHDLRSGAAHLCAAHFQGAFQDTCRQTQNVSERHRWCYARNCYSVSAGRFGAMSSSHTALALAWHSTQLSSSSGQSRSGC